MEPRISIVTLGVADLQRSSAFYEALGWQPAAKQFEGIRFFRCGCMALALYPGDKLAEDAGLPATAYAPEQTFSGVTLAHNTRSREAVDDVLAEAKSAGAEVVKPAAEAFWGGYSGYFRDLDGHLWEVAWNPHAPLDENGTPQLPD
ncbi:VOC family protein [Algihabitans sp.]|uniref:VOC family protein n=1 Tax=Algihabitans sp. TaxID=2821514 RepID=UPI003BA9AFA1